jgi:hypothetical protein
LKSSFFTIIIPEAHIEILAFLKSSLTIFNQFFNTILLFVKLSCPKITLKNNFKKLGFVKLDFLSLQQTIFAFLLLLKKSKAFLI